MSGEQPKDEQLVAHEKVRLSELRLDRQFETVNIIERKAVLLGSFCVAVIGYMAANDLYDITGAVACIKNFGDCGGRCALVMGCFLIAAIKFVSFLSLGAGTYFCAKAQRPAVYYWKGGSPSERAGVFHSRLTDTLNSLAKDYDDAVKDNEVTIASQKTTNLNNAFLWGMCGVGLSFLLIFLEKFMGTASCALAIVAP